LSDLDGEIGRGASVEIFPADDGWLPLSVGEHQLTVVDTDAHGGRAEASDALMITW